jgi:eukaryotic-like serine/threonine-protein kinase
MLRIGDELHSRYRIDFLLGEGGMGAVYQAYDWLKQRKVAVKEFLLHNLPSQVDTLEIESTQAHRGSKPLTHEQAFQQFRREAELLSQLSHANLPEVLDFFTQEDQGYIVMTLIEGKDFYSLMEQQKGPFPEDQVRKWLDQILNALAYCHSHNVIHRDLKPENLILADDGKIYLVDFGIAKALGTTSTLTTVGARALTPGYSPPEQYAGAGGTDERSDIYSIGGVLYFLLTGKNPVESTMRLAGDPMEPPSILNPEISLQMENLILRCMALSKADRPKSVAEIQEMLAGLPEKRDISTRKNARSAPPPNTPSKMKKEDVRTCLWVAIVTVVVLVLSIIGIISIIKGIAGNRPAPTEPVSVLEPTMTPAPSAIPLTVVPTNAPVRPVSTETPLPPNPTLDPMVPPDCTSIGQEWVSPIDGQTLVCVPAGSFRMGGSINCFDTCAHTVELDAYWIDKTEVTNQQFVQFLLQHLNDIRKDGDEFYYQDLVDPILSTVNFGLPPRILGTGMDIHTDPQVADHPVYNVSWYGAQIYCESVGRQLPSEAEWEMAARGTENLIYPWGNEFDCAKANFNEYSMPGACDMYKSLNVAGTSPVGAFPAGASPYGAMDMLGNVSEWVNDWYDASFYYNSPLSNPLGPETGLEKILRDWEGVPPEEMIFRRMNMGPSDSFNLEGFRCAYSSTHAAP